jgi:signal transduction histidine kinase
VFINNVRDEDDARAAEYRAVAGDLLETAFGAIRSWLGVPLMVQDRVMGMLTLSKNERGYYAERHARTVTTIANQAAVAIENARLFEEAESRTRELAALIEISKDVASKLELRPLLGTVIDEMRTIVDYDRASVMVREGDALVVLDSRSAAGAPGDEAVGMRIPLTIAAPLWESVSRGEPAFIADVRDEGDPLAAAYRAIAGPALETVFAGVRGWLGVPLALKEGVIGALALSKDTPGFYDSRHAQLAMTVANQAAVAIENARLFEHAEERARELAALLDVSHTVATTLDVGGLVNLVLDQLQTIIEYTGASVTLLDGDEFSIMASRSASGASAAGARIPLARAQPLWQRILRLEPVVIGDIRSEEPEAREYRAIFGRGIEGTPFRDIRSWLAVPLAPKDRAIGTLTVSHTQPQYFNERHVRLLRAVADQAAVAIENARLYEEAQQRTRETEALLRADQELFRSLDLDAVLSALADVAVDVMRADVSVMTLVADGRERVRAARNFSDEGAAMVNDYLADEPDRGVREPSLFALDDVRDDPRPRTRAIWEHEGLQSYMAVPVAVNGQRIGGFGVGYREPHRFGEGERRVIQALAERGGVAIQNAELYERAQQAASLEERQRLARELHDSVSQALYGIALGARTARTQLDRDPSRAVEPVDYVLSLAEAGLAEMRALIFELRPESLELEGLVAGLEKQAAALRARHGVAVDAALCAEPDVPMPVKEAISRIAQEALHNTVKHARASNVALRLSCEGGVIALEVQDDGRGFDPAQTFAGHLGLRSMRERVANLGGTIAIESEEGAGARIRVAIPVTR